MDRTTRLAREATGPADGGRGAAGGARGAAGDARGAPAGGTPARRPEPDWRRVALRWRQRGPWHGPHWELEAGGVVVARYALRGRLPRHGEIECLGRRWTARGTGLLGGLELCPDDDPGGMLAVRPGWFRPARVTRPAGPELRLRRSFWPGRSTVENAEGFPLVHLVEHRGVARLEGEVEFEDAGRRLEDLEPLVCLLWAYALSERARSLAWHGAHGG